MVHLMHIDLDLTKLLDQSGANALPGDIKRLLLRARSLHSQLMDLREAIGALDMVSSFGEGATPVSISHDFRHEVLGVPCDIRAYLYKSALALYARCFNSTDKRFHQGVDAMLRGAPDLKVVHTKAMKLRDEFVAHYLDTKALDDRVFLRLQYSPDGKSADAIWYPFSRMSYPDADFRINFRRLVVFIHDQIDIKKTTITDELRSAMLNWKSRADLQSLKDQLAPEGLSAIFAPLLQIQPPTQNLPNSKDGE